MHSTSNNKYKHYKFYENGDELNKIMVNNNDKQADSPGGSQTYILQKLNGIFLIKIYLVVQMVLL